MKSTIEHPLAFFDRYLQKEIFSDLKDFYKTITEEMCFEHIVNIDKEMHSVKVVNFHNKDEIDSDYLLWTFEGSIKIKLEQEISKSVKLIETGFLNRFTEDNEVKAFADFLRLKTKIILQQEACQKFTFLQSYFDKIIIVINGYSSKPTINIFTPSFNLLSDATTEQTIKIVKLFDLLTSSPSMIDCTKEEFINAFTGNEVVHGVCWLVIGKNKLTSKVSLFYMIEELIKNNYLSRNILIDLSKYIKYVFRDKDGNEFKNLKQSKATYSESVSSKERIDQIISSL
ncbi:hypothetical protein [Yeosuana sp. AK3]